jgi:hypothetical protein
MSKPSYPNLDDLDLENDDAPPPLPDEFLPAPTRLRADGWTPERQRGFVEHLADCGCVSHAAAHVGMTKQSAYALRRRAPNSMFAYAWDAAIQLARTLLHDTAVERALDGTATPVFHRGEQIGERRVYNDRLLMFLLTQNEKLDRITRPADEIIQLWPAMLDSIDLIGPPPLDREALGQMAEEGDPIACGNNHP